MKLNTILTSSFTALALSSCIYVPVVDKSNVTPNACKTYTQKMTLDELLDKETRNGLVRPFLEAGRGSCSGSGSRSCLEVKLAIMSVPAVVAAGSAIISGSIVVLGNSVYWMEYQGRCDDGYLSQTKDWFLKTLNITPLPTT